MLIGRPQMLAIWLMLISLVLAACSPSPMVPDDQATPKVIDATPTRKDIEPETTATTLPTLIESLGIPTPALLTSTPVATPTTFTPFEMTLAKIPQPGEGRVGEVRWSSDNQSVIFSTYSTDQDETLIEWWNYVIATGTTRPMEEPFHLDPQIWEDLEATRFSNIDPLGTISPSGLWFIFTRVSPDSSSTPVPDKPSLLPVEIWIANLDGSKARKIGGPFPGCQKLGQIAWSHQESRVLFTCGYEGPSGLFLANTDGSWSATLGEITGFEAGVGFGHIAVSPDGSQIALTDSSGMLQIVPLDGADSKDIGFGLMPNWSLDSRRLYYLRGQEYMSGPIDGIHVYDVETGIDSEVLQSPIHSPSGDGVTISKGQFAVSSAENAAVFQSRGLWLVVWSP